MSHVEAEHLCIALHEACFLDFPEEVRRALAEGVDPNCRDEVGQTPLIVAASGGSVEAAKVLLEYGVDVNARDPFGDSPLTHARNGLARAENAGASSAPNYAQVAEMIEAAGGHV